MSSPSPAPSPLSVEAWPLVVSAPAGKSVHYTVTVRDTGTKPINVSTKTLVLHGQCSHLQFSPSHLALRPGQQQHVTVTAPAGTPTDYLAEFSGTIAHVHGFAPAAVVGSRLIVGQPAKTVTACTAPKAVVPHPQAAGTPWWIFAAVAAAVLLAVVVAVRMWRRHRTA